MLHQCSVSLLGAPELFLGLLASRDVAHDHLTRGSPLVPHGHARHLDQDLPAVQPDELLLEERDDVSELLECGAIADQLAVVRMDDRLDRQTDQHRR